MFSNMKNSDFAEAVTEHWASLPRHRSSAFFSPFGTFLGLPALAAVWAYGNAVLDATLLAGVIAGTGVLGGLLFQVLAWTANRLARLADVPPGTELSPNDAKLLVKLDVARTNIAYSALLAISVVFAAMWGSLLAPVTRAPAALLVAAVVHLVLTLLLLVLRINRIAHDDRIAALTSHAHTA